MYSVAPIPYGGKDTLEKVQRRIVRIISNMQGSFEDKLGRMIT